MTFIVTYIPIIKRRSISFLFCLTLSLLMLLVSIVYFCVSGIRVSWMPQYASIFIHFRIEHHFYSRFLSQKKKMINYNAQLSHGSDCVVVKMGEKKREYDHSEQSWIFSLLKEISEHFELYIWSHRFSCFLIPSSH